MLKIVLTFFLICGTIPACSENHFSKPPDVLPGRPSTNILDYGKHYWRSLPDWESKRIFTEGYLLGTTGAIFQISLIEKKEPEYYREVMVDGIGAGYIVYLMDEFYNNAKNEDAPVLNALYRVIIKERSKKYDFNKK